MMTGQQRFLDKVAIVTGGGSGIGRAITERLLAEGARVFVAQRSSSDVGEFVETDLSQHDHCEVLVNTVLEQAGKIDLLINNAGMMEEKSISDMTVEEWNQNLAVNLTAPFLLTKFALPSLRKQQGSIVNIGSIEGLGANPLHSAYCASKGGLHGLTRAIAVDHGADGIRCNAVAPGWIDTDLNQAFIASQQNADAFREKIGTIHPVGRTGRPEEIANLVCWLASDEAGFVTGQVFTIDGGRMAKLSLPG